MNDNVFFNKLKISFAKRFTLSIRNSFRCFGDGSIIYFPVQIDNPARMIIGKEVEICSGAWLNVVEEHAGRHNGGVLITQDSCSIGNYAQITICKSVRLGRNVVIGRSVIVADHFYDYRYTNHPIFSALLGGEPIVIEDDVLVMTNFFITPGVKIGRHAYIGPNSVVISDIPAFSLAVGNPAKIVKKYNPKTSQWKKMNG